MMVHTAKEPFLLSVSSHVTSRLSFFGMSGNHEVVSSRDAGSCFCPVIVLPVRVFGMTGGQISTISVINTMKSKMSRGGEEPGVTQVPVLTYPDGNSGSPSD